MSGSQNARKHKYNESYFENIFDDYNKIYWLGFIMADGCIYKGTDKNSYRLQINLKADDIDHLEKFQEAIGSDYKIQIKELKNSKVALLKINSTKMCKDLMNLGVVERKSLICKPPTLTGTQWIPFIRGYFDGDGCITKNVKRDRWSFEIVGGDDMLLKFQKILPVETQIYEFNHSEAIRLVTSSHEKIYELYKWLYEGQQTFLQRKYNKFLEFENFYKSRLVEMQGQ